MATNKQMKNEGASTSGGGAKRSKLDPAKVPLPKEDNGDISAQLKLITEIVSDNAKNLKEVKEEMKSLTARMERFELKTDQMEKRMSANEAELKKCKMYKEKVEFLSKEMEDIINREKRNNLRIIGLPEGVENNDAITFLEQFLPKILPLKLKFPLEFERAHRIPVRRVGKDLRPRPLIFKLLRHQQVMEIIKLAKENKNLKCQDAKIHIVPDFAKATADKRKKMLDLRPQMRQLGAKFGLLYPAIMRVTYANKTMNFDCPDKLKDFLDDCEHLMIS